MNELVEKLSEQADLYARSDNSSMLFENYRKRYSEKLVELIVQECCKVSDEIEAYELPYKTSRFIREHFGIEE